MLNNRKITCLLSSVFIYAVASLSTQAFAASINEVMQEGENRADAGETAQKQVDSVADQTEKIEVSLPVDGKPIMHDITAQLKEACSIIIAPILDGIHKLVASHNPEFQEVLRQNVILSGGGASLNGLNKQIEDGLDELGGGRVSVAEEPLFAGAHGALQLAVDMPSEYWQQLS